MQENKIKSENFWLRAGITLVLILWLSSLAFINRGIIQERKKLTDSLTYYKLQNDTLNKNVDSLMDENFEFNRENAQVELMLYNLSEQYPKYKNIEKDLEKERNSNKYE